MFLHKLIPGPRKGTALPIIFCVRLWRLYCNNWPPLCNACSENEFCFLWTSPFSSKKLCLVTFQTMFSEKGYYSMFVLCLFNLKLLDTWLLTCNGQFSLLYILCSLLFCDIVLRVTVFLLCIVLFIVPVLCYPNWDFFRAFFSVVRKIPGYNLQRRGTARTSQVFLSLYYVYCLCVNVWCTAATGCQPSCG
jgi:hypothetical protein